MNKKIFALLLTLCLVCGLAVPAFALQFTDAHGNVVELDDTLEAHSPVALYGANDAARKGESNLGDLWADALLWFAASGKINAAFDEDDVAAGNGSVDVPADHIVALWNGGNLRADIAEGKFGAAELAKVLPYPNKVAVIYMTGAQLAEALEAASQGLPYCAATADACASLMQVAGMKYTVNMDQPYDAGEAYGKCWFKANSLGRVTITEVNGKSFSADDTYAVITHNANYNGMDSSYMFKDAVADNDKCAITTAVVRDVVWMYIDQQLNNRVPETYAKAQGRITLEGSAFTDVKLGMYYTDAVAWAAEQGITGGTADGIFAPDNACTRAQAVTFLWRAAGSPEPAQPASFSDVAANAYYAKAVAWAAEQGITGGTSATAFTPNATCTRGQIVTFLYRFNQTNTLNIKENPFTDVAEGAYYYDAVLWAAERGITGGTTATTFAPGNACTRGQIVTFLFRCMGK